MLPGLPKEMRDVDVDDRELARVEAIIKSMTKDERANPDAIDASRRARIAKGSGTNPNQVAMLVKQFSEMQKMMKRFGMAGGGKKGKKGKMRGGFPGMAGGMPDLGDLQGLGLPGAPGAGAPGGFPGLPGPKR
jgi:signal recognition particle subunit SRP54